MMMPLASPIPEPPEGEYFTEDQWRILLSIMDAIVPSIHSDSTAHPHDELSQLAIPDAKWGAAVNHLNATLVDPPDTDTLGVYFAEKPSDNPDFKDLLERTLVFYVREDARNGLIFVINALK